MSKFKVKVGDAWIFRFTWQTSAMIDEERMAKIFDTDDVEYLQSEIRSRFNSKVVEFIPITDEKQPVSKPKELDLCEMLKDAPMRLKLWSVIYGEVEFSRIVSGGIDYPILVNVSDGSVRSIASDGLFNKRLDGECTLFPSKDNRDWSTFKLPYKLPVKGELCWTMSSVGNWIPRFATGNINGKGMPIFFQFQLNHTKTDTYNWQPLIDVPKVLKNHLKLK